MEYKVRCTVVPYIRTLEATFLLFFAPTTHTNSGVIRMKVKKRLHSKLGLSVGLSLLGILDFFLGLVFCLSLFLVAAC